MISEDLKIIVAKRIEKRKVAKSELWDLIVNKLKAKIPTKQEAIKYLKKHVKSPKDVEDAYAIIPKLLPILKKSYVTADFEVFPRSFIKNLMLLIAIGAVFEGTFPAKSEALKEVTIVTEGFEPIGYVRADDLKKFIEKGDNLAIARINILKAIENKELRLNGGSLPKDMKSYQLILTDDKYSDFYYSVSKLQNAQGIVYLHKDTPGTNKTITKFK